ncbi:RHS repeat domain-containing protein [Flavobacterium columnare]|uniref:RHS repeat domain-containing protein n=1 Tax=Flavobacterium columnare TaxID=996 RepID=UPI0040338F30
MLGEEVYSIINDYLGTPVQAYNSNGKLIWERELDIYGKTRKIEGDQNLIPFLYQGQYYDHDIELAYNRFRYYDPEAGRYISQDPIGLLSGEPNFYAYVRDSNTWIDPFGLNGELVYQLVGKDGVNYYGITSRDALTRMNEHIANGKVFDRMEVLADNLSHDQARSIEGALIRKRMNERLSLSDRRNLSIEEQLKKAGLDNKNRGRVKERWLSDNPLDDLSDKMNKKPKKVKCG